MIVLMTNHRINSRISQPDTLPASIGGKQPDGRKVDPPMYGFGSATRDKVRAVFVSNDHQKTDFYGKDSPGPATYLLPPSVGGKQPDGKKADPPSWSMSSTSRAPVEGVVESPRAIYAVQSVIGPQSDGKFPNAPSFGFGASTRDVRLACSFARCVARKVECVPIPFAWTAR